MTPPATTSDTTLGAQIRNSDATRSAIDAIVQQVAAAGAQLTDVAPPKSEALTVAYDQLLSEAADVRGRPLLYPYVGSGAGNGPFVELADGSVKMDLISGIGVHFFGHGDPDLVGTAVEAATADVVMQGHLQMNEEAIRFNQTIVELAKRHSNLAHAFLCSSGAMANENALKVCHQKHDGAPRVLAFAHCFMGRSITMCQIGDNAAARQGIPLSTLVDYLPFYDHVAARRMNAGDVSGSTRYIDMCCYHLEQYIARYPGQHAAFIFELVQGEGGFNTALPDYHRALMQICKDHNIAVWDDEVQTFGRTESLFCYEALGLGDMIDVCTIGKMSQVCAALYTADYNPKPGLLSGTFLGSAAPLRVGRRIIERLADGDYYGPTGTIRKHHHTFIDHVRALAEKHPNWFPHNHLVHDVAAGYGGMMRFTPFGGHKDPVLKLCRALYDEGIIAFYCGHGPFHVRFLPPLGVMKLEQWDRVFELVEAAMTKVADSLAPHDPGEIRPMRRAIASDQDDED